MKLYVAYIHFNARIVTYIRYSALVLFTFNVVFNKCE
jgi:hypothetical protein